MRFLYALGFKKSSIFDSNGAESWEFEYSSQLQEALNFYFKARKSINGNGELYE